MNKGQFVNGTTIGALVLMGLLLLGTAAVHAGEAVDKTLDVKADGVVRIDNVRGRIDVQGWDRSAVSVTGTLDDRTTKFTFETASSTTTVKVEVADNLRGGEGSNLVIRVPTASRVRVGLVSADLALADLHGGIESETVSGDVDAAGVSGGIEMQTVSGDIDVAGADGKVTLRTVSGDIEADAESEEIEFSTVSGDGVVTSGKRVKDAKFSTISGDVEVNADAADGARIKGSSVSGDVRLRINRDVGAVVELGAGSGALTNELTADRPQRRMGSGEHLRFTIGDGAGSIDLTTISGNVELLSR